MKKLLLTALLFSCITVYAQEKSPYLLNEIKTFMVNYEIKNKYKLNEITSIILLVLIIFVSPNKNYEQTKSEIIKIDKYKKNCELANNYLSEREKWIFTTMI